MFEHAQGEVLGIDRDENLRTASEVYAALRGRIGLEDFGELMFSMPNPAYPRLSKLLPRMASEDVQKEWAGESGPALLRLTCAFARAAWCGFARWTGRSLEGARILDYGCGFGRVSRLFYYHTAPDDVYGVDPWDRAIAICQADELGANFHQSNYLPETLPVNGGPFDFAVALSVFTHTSERATIAGLSALRRHIRDDGLLMITLRPIEYWAAGAELYKLYDAEPYEQAHRQTGFAFFPHPRETVDNDLVYGETSMTPAWFERNVRDWRIAGVDNALIDPFQIYVFLRPA